jgi:hypothetical protein
MKTAVVNALSQAPQYAEFAEPVPGSKKGSGSFFRFSNARGVAPAGADRKSWGTL